MTATPAPLADLLTALDAWERHMQHPDHTPNCNEEEHLCAALVAYRAALAAERADVARVLWAYRDGD